MTGRFDNLSEKLWHFATGLDIGLNSPKNMSNSTANNYSANQKLVSDYIYNMNI